MESFYSRITKLLELKNPLPYSNFFDIINNVLNILDSEKNNYRLPTKNNELGSLLDFTESKNLPLIIIPDIHARTDFIKNILDFKILPELKFLNNKKSISIFNALKQKKIRVICVGDALHTEVNTAQRWENIQEEFLEDIHTGPAMTAEAKECFSTLAALMMLKTFFPENFHFLKGNHENINNTTGNGNYAFRKLADEGQMLKTFIQEYYGDDILFLISCYEDSLPLIAATNNCVISHAEPRTSYTKEQLINAKNNSQIIEDLTWTSNGEAEENSAKQIINNLIPNNNKSKYFGGHRPVKTNYNSLQNDTFYQIHNPHKQNIVLIYNNRPFNPETDIIGVNQWVTNFHKW